MPLGAIPGADFPVSQFMLADNDTLTLMTDGVAKAQDAEGLLFGFDRIAEILRVHRTPADSGRCRAILRPAGRHHGANSLPGTSPEGGAGMKPAMVLPFTWFTVTPDGSILLLLVASGNEIVAFNYSLR